MSGIFSKTTKLMLRNVLRHTDSHNRLVEEAEMWQQFDRQKTTADLDHSHPSFQHDDRCDREVYSDGQLREQSSAGRKRKGQEHRHMPHMDQEHLPSTYWMRQLDKAERADPNRWDHSGYKELYPEDFDSDKSYESIKSSDMHELRTRKLKHGKKRQKKKMKMKRRKLKDQTPEEKQKISSLEDLRMDRSLAKHALHPHETEDCGQKCHEHEGERHKRCHKRCHRHKHKNRSTCHKHHEGHEQEGGNHLSCHNNAGGHDGRDLRNFRKHHRYHSETDQSNPEDEGICRKKRRQCKSTYKLMMSGHKPQSLDDGFMEWVEVTADSIKHKPEANITADVERVKVAAVAYEPDT